MKSTKALMLAFLVLACLVMPYENIYTCQRSSKPLVVTTTSVLSSVVEDLAGDIVDVLHIVPPSLCPGHYDIRPGDVELIRSASLVIKHGIMGEFWLKTLIDKANESGDLRIPVVTVGGSWNTPNAARTLYKNVASALKNYLGIDINQRLNACLQAINATEIELMELAYESKFKDVPVVVMLWQKSFVELLGFRVVATYGPPEKLTESDIIEIEENATKEGAKLVIDNIHSGVSVGKRIANDIGAIHVALINFPGVIPEANNLTSMMMYNARLLAEAVNYYEYQIEIQRLRQRIDTLTHVIIAIGLVVVAETLLILAMIMRRKKI